MGDAGQLQLYSKYVKDSPACGEGTEEKNTVLVARVPEGVSSLEEVRKSDEEETCGGELGMFLLVLIGSCSGGCSGRL